VNVAEVIKTVRVKSAYKIHALVDGMKVIITESSVRRDLQLAEEDGFYGKETPLFPTMVGSNQIQIGEGSPQPTDTQHTPTFAMPPLKPKKTQKPRQPKRKTTKVHQPSEYTDIVVDEAVHKEGLTVCWVLEQMHMGRSGLGVGTVPVSLGAQEIAGGEG
nr:hypothetical protein [Tanacetum cinerariifolium]